MWGGIFMAGNYYTPFSLRISEDLLEKVKYIAKENKRSMNKEVEFVLEKYVKTYEKENGAIIWSGTFKGAGPQQ